MRHNVHAISAVLTPGCRYMAVVKANAYGHGDVLVAQAALESGAHSLGVILVNEGRRLREAGIDAPILLLHEVPPHQVDEAIAFGLTPTVFTPGAIENLGEAAKTTLKVHVKVDTGLNRLGAPPQMIDEVAVALSKQHRLEVEAIFSHFAVADPPDDPSIAMQLERFEEAIQRLGIDAPLKHIGNSATALTHPEAHFDLVRVGISTYGIAPAASMRGIVELKPAMSLKAKIAMAKRVPRHEGISYGLHYRLRKPSMIATLPLGYADGWPRHSTGRTEALIGGRRYPVVGTICMDSFMVDLGDDACEIGDEAVLIGSQGNERISADDVAEQLGTIPYEVTTQISSRIERVPVG